MKFLSYKMTAKDVCALKGLSCIGICENHFIYTYWPHGFVTVGRCGRRLNTGV